MNEFYITKYMFTSQKYVRHSMQPCGFHAHPPAALQMRPVWQALAVAAFHLTRAVCTWHQAAVGITAAAMAPTAESAAQQAGSAGPLAAEESSASSATTTQDLSGMVVGPGQAMTSSDTPPGNLPYAAASADLPPTLSTAQASVMWTGGVLMEALGAMAVGAVMSFIIALLCDVRCRAMFQKLEGRANSG